MNIPRIPRISTNGVLVWILGIVMIVGLLSIPELISYQKELSGTAETPNQTARNVTQRRERVKDSEVSGQSPLEKVLAALDGGIIDRLKARRLGLEDTGSESDGRAGLNLAALSSSKDKKAAGQKEKTADQPVNLDGLNWKQIRGGEIGKRLNALRKDAMVVMEQLERGNQTSRFAIFNLVNGIDKVSKGGFKGTSPQEALLYIEQLDGSVTHALLEEKVSPRVFRQWQSVSVGKLLEGVRDGYTKELIKNRFNPEISLDTVRVIKKPGKRGSNVDGGKVSVQVTGFTVGKGVKRIVFLVDGHVKRKGKPSTENREGVRTFRSPLMNGRGIITIRAESKDGDRVEKSYRFYPRANNFVWRKSDGVYVFPFRSGMVDPSVDRYFRFYGGGDASEGGASVEGDQVGAGGFSSF